MNRRRFLSWLGVGVAVGVVAPATVISMVPSMSGSAVTETICLSTPASIGTYADYISFSDISIAKAIDEAVTKAAKELSDGIRH